MQFEKHNFGYSMKNIPLIKEKDYKPLFLDSISKFMTNLEWKANFYLHPEKFMLCNVEKAFIIYNPEISSLNSRNELFGFFFHKERYLLLNS